METVVIFLAPIDRHYPDSNAHIRQMYGYSWARLFKGWIKLNPRDKSLSNREVSVDKTNCAIRLRVIYPAVTLSTL